MNRSKPTIDPSGLGSIVLSGWAEHVCLFSGNPISTLQKKGDTDEERLVDATAPHDLWVTAIALAPSGLDDGKLTFSGNQYDGRWCHSVKYE